MRGWRNEWFSAAAPLLLPSTAGVFVGFTTPGTTAAALALVATATTPAGLAALFAGGVMITTRPTAIHTVLALLFVAAVAVIVNG